MNFPGDRQFKFYVDRCLCVITYSMKYTVGLRRSNAHKSEPERYPMARFCTCLYRDVGFEFNIYVNALFKVVFVY